MNPVLIFVSVKINQESMTIVEDDAIDEDEVTVCIHLQCITLQ